MENALFAKSAPAVTCVLKLLRGGIPQAKTTAQQRGARREVRGHFRKEKEV